jgi:hypothetical protein
MSDPKPPPDPESPQPDSVEEPGALAPLPSVQEGLDERARQRERAATWLREKWQTPANCIVCGQNNWQIGEVFELRAFHGGNLVLGGGNPVLPVFPVSCNVCGNTVFINALRAGVVDAGPREDSAGAKPEPDEADE